MKTTNTELESRLGIPGRVIFQEGQGDLPTLEIKTPWSTAEVYLHGAHVTHFQKRGEAPVLFLSKVSQFVEGAPIRGRIPVIFPWFGPREGHPAHGFARVKAWDLMEITLSADGSIRLHFRLPTGPEAEALPASTVDYFVTVAEQLTLELTVTNNSADREFAFEDCLHTYFAVGDINAVEVRGLKGAAYFDRLENPARKMETSDAIRFTAEMDRTYLDTSAPVDIIDACLRRKIRVEKDGSRSNVVWNPWIAKAQRMPDFGNEEYLEMVCVESGNVAANQITLQPGASHTLRVSLSTAPTG